MIRIACEDRRDRAWLERFVRGRALPARLGREGEGWELLLCRDGSIRGLGQLVTCGSDPRCTLTVSSLLQEGGMAALQREIRTAAGEICLPRELSLAGLPGPLRQRLAEGAILLLLGKIPGEGCAGAEKRV